MGKAQIKRKGRQWYRSGIRRKKMEPDSIRHNYQENEPCKNARGKAGECGGKGGGMREKKQKINFYCLNVCVYEKKAVPLQPN